jgi:hypothetical protein
MMVALRKEDRSHWPRGLRMPREGYYAFQFAENGVVRGIGRVTEAEAIAACADLVDRYKTALVYAQLQDDDRRAVRMKDDTYRRAEARAKKFGRELMTRAEFDAMWERAGAKCELTGVAFRIRPADCVDRMWPWGASLDRIDNSKGYAYGNSRLVCIAMNMALQDFGEDVFRVLALSYKMYQAGLHPHASSTPLVKADIAGAQDEI